MKRSVLFLAGVLLAFGLLFTGCPTSGGDNGPKESRVIYEKSFTTFELKTDEYSEGNIQNQLATDGISEKIVKGKRVLVLFEGTPDKDLKGLYVQLADGTADAGYWGALTEETPWDIDDLDEPEGDDEYVSEIELTTGEKFEGRLVLNTVGTSTANTGAANKFAIKVYGSENDKGEPGFGSEKLTFSDVKLAIVVLEGDDDGSTFTLGDTPPAADEPLFTFDIPANVGNYAQFTVLDLSAYDEGTSLEIIADFFDADGEEIASSDWDRLIMGKAWESEDFSGDALKEACNMGITGQTLDITGASFVTLHTKDIEKTIAAKIVIKEINIE